MVDVYILQQVTSIYIKHFFAFSLVSGLLIKQKGNGQEIGGVRMGNPGRQGKHIYYSQKVNLETEAIS